MNSGCKLLVSGAYLPFDGNTGTYYDNGAYATIGINFSRRLHIAGCRFMPRYNNPGRASYRNYYGATSAENYAAGTKVPLGYIPGLIAYTWTFVPSTDTTNTYQYCWMTADLGNLCEMQIYGWTPEESLSPVGHAYFEVADFTHCAPVVTWTFQAGAERAALEISRHTDDSFTELTSITNPVGISAVHTNTSAKVGVKRYYRVAVTSGGTTVYSTPAAYTRYRRLERNPTNETVRLSKYTYMQVNGFDGNAATYTASSPIGVNFNEQVYFAAFRTRPRPGWAGRLTGKSMYASATATDYSANVKVEIGGPDLAFEGQFQLIPSHNLESGYQYCYISPDYGNLDEMQVYGWDSADIDASGDPFFPTTLTALNGDALGEVALAWSGGKNLDAYAVEYRQQGETAWTAAVSGLATNIESYVVTGLTAATNYAFRIAATGDGTTGYSPEATVYIYQLVPGTGTGLNTAYVGPVTTRPLSNHNYAERRVNATVDIDQASGSLFVNTNLTSALVLYRGKLIAPLDGTYTLKLETSGTDGYALYLDGVQKLNTFASASVKYTTLALTAGEHDLAIDYRSANTAKYLKFTWALENVWGDTLVPQSQLMPAADADMPDYTIAGCNGWDFSIATAGASTIARLWWLGDGSFRMTGEQQDRTYDRLALLTQRMKGPFTLYMDAQTSMTMGRPSLFAVSESGNPDTSISFMYTGNSWGVKAGSAGIDYASPPWNAISSGATQMRLKRDTDKTLEFSMKNAAYGSDWRVCFVVSNGVSCYCNGVSVNKTLALDGDALQIGFSLSGNTAAMSDVTVTNFRYQRDGLLLQLR